MNVADEYKVLAQSNPVGLNEDSSAGARLSGVISQGEYHNRAESQAFSVTNLQVIDGDLTTLKEKRKRPTTAPRARQYPFEQTLAKAPTETSQK